MSAAAADRLRAQVLSQLQTGPQTPGAQRAALQALSGGQARVAQEGAIAAAQERERYLDAAQKALYGVGAQDVTALSPAVTEQGQGRSFMGDMERLGLGYYGAGLEDKRAVWGALQDLDKLQEASRQAYLERALRRDIQDSQTRTDTALGLLKLGENIAGGAIRKWG